MINGRSVFRFASRQPSIVLRSSTVSRVRAAHIIGPITFPNETRNAACALTDRASAGGMRLRWNRGHMKRAEDRPGKGHIGGVVGSKDRSTTQPPLADQSRR